jgi:hypothetical protein
MQTEDWEIQAHERRCAHCSSESPGETYPARDYLRLLQGHRGAEATALARLVEPFFWSDADVMHIRLCARCATSLGLEEATGELPPTPPTLARAPWP